MFLNTSLNHIAGCFFFFPHKRQIFNIEIIQREMARAFCFIVFVVFIDSRDSDFFMFFYNCVCLKKY